MAIFPNGLRRFFLNIDLNSKIKSVSNFFKRDISRFVSFFVPKSVAEKSQVPTVSTIKAMPVVAAPEITESIILRDGNVEVKIKESDSMCRIESMERKLEELKVMAISVSEESAKLREESAEIRAKFVEIREKFAEVIAESAKLREESARLGEESARLGEESARLGEESARLGEESARRFKVLHELRRFREEIFHERLTDEMLADTTYLNRYRVARNPNSKFVSSTSKKPTGKKFTPFNVPVIPKRWVKRT